MLVFDASAIIHAWDHYPPMQFPPLWRWLASRIKKNELGICEVARSEVEKRSPDCHQWLAEQGITCVEMTDIAVKKAAEIKSLLGIVNERYNPAGVAENDILIVASAFVERQELISNERRQPDLPQNKAKYKIPAVCVMQEIAVPCIDFLTLIKQSGEVFDEGRKT